MKRIGTKRCKISISGQKLRSGTGTTIQNVYGTGTEQSGTGTTVSKMPRFL